MAITKGGVLKSYFPGKGSKSNQEYHAVGRVMELGTDDDGQSLTVNGEGTVSLINWSKPRTTDNVGVSVQSLNGAVEILGGGSSTNDDGLDSIRLVSATGVGVSGATRVKVTAPSISLTDAQEISSTASQTISLTSGNAVTVTTSKLNVSASGGAEYAFSGGGLGSARSTTFTANPATGALGGAVDSWKSPFGGMGAYVGLGRYDFDVSLGSFNVTTQSLKEAGFGIAGLAFDGVPDFAADNPGDNDGINLVAGPTDAVASRLILKSFLLGNQVTLAAGTAGNISIQAPTGKIHQAALLGIKMVSPDVRVVSPAGSVQVVLASPNTGGVLTDGVIDSFTGRPFLANGTVGVANFRVL
jgi:hypothetical protein